MSAYCNNCGAAAQGASFCASCGSAIGQSAPNAGFQAQGAAYPSAGNSVSNGMWAHLGGLLAFFFGGMVLGWVPPLIIRGSASAQNDRYVYDQATEALNFQLQWLIINAGLIVVSIITCGIGSLLYIVSWALPIIFGIMASVASSRGENYRYPMMFMRLVK